MYNSTFDMKKIRNVVVCSLDMDNTIKSRSVSRAASILFFIQLGTGKTQETQLTISLRHTLSMESRHLTELEIKRNSISVFQSFADSIQYRPTQTAFTVLGLLSGFSFTFFAVSLVLVRYLR